MVNVFPFKGIVYNGKKIKNLAKVVSPPYDVISPDEQKALYAASEYNIVRLILGREFPDDSEYNNKYIRAAACFEGWMRHDMLRQDEKPAIYIYEQKFKVGSKTYRRIGFISLVRMEDLSAGKIFPHEDTLAKPKLDRVELIKATNANFDCIFSLFEDDRVRIAPIFKRAMKRKPLICVKDKQNIINSLWRVDSKELINKIVKEMKDKDVFIADGHHRYEAALRYKKEMKDRNTRFTDEESYNHVMMFFTPLSEDLVIFPIHRLIAPIPNFDTEKFIEELKTYFEIETFSFTKRTEAAKRLIVLKECQKKGQTEHAYVLYLQGGTAFYLLTLKNKEIVNEMVEESKPDEWKNLDVTILHTIALKHILNLYSEDQIKYTKSAEEAVEKVKTGQFQMTFLLNATRVEDVIAIARKREKMPQKSTYFYPKLLTGMVMHKVIHGDKVVWP